MHIDLNSCFATIEQQAFVHFRGKPLVVAAYATPSGCVLSPSIEAKKLGIKVGMAVRDARLLCKNIIVRTPDPAKYRSVHEKFCRLFRDYSPQVVPKSIDEAVIDFSETPVVQKRALTDIGLEIKQRMRKEIGEWITCNIGIGTNRFLAKTAASLHKPDGLDIITAQNLKNVYKTLILTDFCGINTRFEARLNACGIFSPLSFLESSLEVLQKKVFRSIAGYYWYLRLRGYEIDSVSFTRRSFGQSYALPKATGSIKELSKLLIKLCEKMGRRLRRENFAAYGIHLSCLYKDRTYWHKGKTFSASLYTTQELFTKALLVLNSQPEKKSVANLAVSCFSLAPSRNPQLDLFNSEFTKKRQLSDALDEINNKYGEFAVSPALMMGMKDTIIDRIAFGQ